MQKKIIDKLSLIFASVLFLISFLLIFSYTSEFLGSIAAALLTAALGWAAFVIVRLTWFSLK
ncbi:MAG TPA: hypothetical protein PLC42_03970 [Parachlamydiaceae bacterium]|nr:hypothetical protein [Parachlamydiaceae bacterium]